MLDLGLIAANGHTAQGSQSCKDWRRPWPTSEAQVAWCSSGRSSAAVKVRRQRQPAKALTAIVSLRVIAKGH